MSNNRSRRDISINLGDLNDYNIVKIIASQSLKNYSLEKKKFYERMQRTGALLLIANCGGKPVGFIAGYPTKDKIFHIWLFGVERKNQRKGIGTKLLKRLHALLKKRGFVTVETLTFNKYVGKIILSLKMGYKIKKTKFIKSKNDLGIFLEKEL